MPPRAAFITRYVDPLERLSEFLFGLIIVLSFTLDAGLVVGEGEQATRQMLLAIVGCNIAWGLLLGIRRSAQPRRPLPRAIGIMASVCHRTDRTDAEQLHL